MTGSLDLLGQSLERIATGVRADWGVYIKFLATGDEIDLNADATMDTMSVIKLPLLIELYGQAEGGRIDLGQWLTLRADDKRLGTGILHLLKDGSTLTLSDAATLMIVQSDNTATDLCFAAVGGPEAVTRLARSLDLASIEAVGTAFDWFSALCSSMDPALAELSPAQLYAAGYPTMPPAELESARASYHFSGGRPFGLASARDLGRLLELIWKREAASPTVCEHVLETLRKQQHRTRIPKYLLHARC